ncbi:hypothetical protein EV363DRAFT_1162813 [Boletus edulis]|nr:hypothetical protein EV363DRAFT_1162813 [Boletus edulis]
MAASRSLSFTSNDLGTSATLMFIFDGAGGLYQGRFPVVLQTSTFQSNGVSRANLNFVDQPAWINAREDQGAIVATSYQPLDYGQETTLLKDPQTGHFFFDDPKPGVPSNVTVENGTDDDRGVGLVGFVKDIGTDNEKLVPAYYWDNFVSSESIGATLQPILHAYVTSDYREGLILQDPISVAAIFEEDLLNLEPDTSWTLSYDPSNGQFSITSRG